MALRTPLSVTPHLYMGDSTGRPLDMGTVYFGEQDKDPEFYPIELFSDDALTKPLAQPVHTKGGYLYDKGDMVEPHAKELIYSVKVLDSYGRKVFYKGAMMRNSWNDDVIEQINTAIIGSADVARQVATDITNDAINNTAVEGGVLADTFVTVTASGEGTVARNLRDVNSDIKNIKSFVDVNTAYAQALANNFKLYVPDGDYTLTEPNIDMSVFYGNGTVNGAAVSYPSAAKRVTVDKPAIAGAPAIIRSVQDEIRDGMFNVARMGAKANNSFDSTDAFLKAQEEAVFLGAKGLYVPSGAEYYNISAPIMHTRNGSSGGLSLIGEGVNMTKLRWVGGSGTMINAFSDWQYGFEMRGFSIDSLATTPAQITNGSVGIHIEKNQAQANIRDIKIEGFDTNIDIGVHAQFMTFTNVHSRKGNVLLNAYGQNSDKNMWVNCVFYAPVKVGTYISSPRNTFLDCWWGGATGWSETDYNDIVVGYQNVRTEDIGKSISLTSKDVGMHGQHSSLIRPRFERNNTYTGEHIVFKNITERVSDAELQPFTIDNPVFPNKSTVAPIRISDNRRGIVVNRPVSHDDTPLLINDVVSTSDGSIQYVNVIGGDIGGKYAGQRAMITKGEGKARFGSSDKVDLLPTAVVSSTDYTYDSVNKMLNINKIKTESLTFVTVTRPATVAKDAKFYVKASSENINRLTIQVFAGSTQLLKCRNYTVDELKSGVSIVIPNSASTSVKLYIAAPASSDANMLFEELCYFD